MNGVGDELSRVGEGKGGVNILEGERKGGDVGERTGDGIQMILIRSPPAC